MNNASDWFDQNPSAVNDSGPGLPQCPMCDEAERDDCETFTDEFGRSFVTVRDVSRVFQIFLDCRSRLLLLHCRVAELAPQIGSVYFSMLWVEWALPLGSWRYVSIIK